MEKNNALKTQLLLGFHAVFIFLLSLYGTREGFALSFVFFTIAFVLYIITYRIFALDLKSLFIWALVARLVTLPFLPQLSEDYLRFFFDGFLFNSGQNPYLILPSRYLMENGTPALQDLLAEMNSPDYFTIYPPVSQYLFGIVFRLSGGSLSLFVLLSKISFILFDLGVIGLLSQILQRIGSPVKYTFLYAFNPLIIIELTGNLHTEGVAVFFSLASLYLLLQRKWVLSSLVLGIAISVKLLPFLILPVFIKYLGGKRGIVAGVISCLLFLLTFLPFLSYDTIVHFGSSVDLYFRTFEFNAYLYFILRELISRFIGYNPISFLGPFLAAVSGLSILLVSIHYIRTPERRQFTGPIVFIYLLYFTLATTVHPWYISWIIVFSIFHKQNHLLLTWSYLVVLSYFFYNDSVQTGWWWWLEYSLLTILLLFLLSGTKNPLSLPQKKISRQKADTE